MRVGGGLSRIFKIYITGKNTINLQAFSERGGGGICVFQNFSGSLNSSIIIYLLNARHTISENIILVILVSFYDFRVSYGLYLREYEPF